MKPRYSPPAWESQGVYLELLMRWLRKLVRNRDRFNINYWVIKSPALENMKEVVRHLAGG